MEIVPGLLSVRERGVSLSDEAWQEWQGSAFAGVRWRPAALDSLLS
jgi:hypothetical protein